MAGNIFLAEAAETLGITTKTLTAQIRAGKFKATKRGRDWMTTEKEVERYRLNHLGKVGRPRKNTAAKRPPRPKPQIAADGTTIPRKRGRPPKVRIADAETATA